MKLYTFTNCYDKLLNFSKLISQTIDHVLAKLSDI